MGSVLTAAENTIADKMAGVSEAELREAFKLFDIDGDGVITIEELSSLVSKVGGDMSNADATALIKAADKDGNMGLDFSGFAKLDVDKSGFITKDEMVATISSGFTGDKLEEAKKALDQMDVDKDGKVSYPEFLLVMKYKK